jgi:transposase InsO family protein
MNAKARLGWVRLYEQTGNAALVCRRCGISAPTLRKWVRRYEAEGLVGLEDRSRRPKTSPQQRVFAKEEQLILGLRRTRHLGIKRLRNELLRLHSLKLALGTIHAVLVRHGENRLRRPRLQRKGTRRYSRPVPGERVQMDVCKIGKGIFQYTAVDDCTRYRVLGLAPDKTATSTLAFLDQVIAGMPFPIQRIQTDRGAEFFAYEVQERLMRERIRFRPIRPRSPHLNGKVERSQRTDLEEFWPTADFAQPDLDGQLASWLRFYNHERPHDSLQGQTPVQRLAELQHRIPRRSEVAAAYDPSREDFRTRHYLFDQAIRELKASR